MINAKSALPRLGLAIGLLAATGLASVPAAKADGIVGGPTHGAWMSYMDETDGSYSCGIRTEMKHGGFLALDNSKPGEVDLLAYDPSWHLAAGVRYPVTIVVGGEGYRGTAIAVGADELAMPSVSRSLLEAWYAEDSAVADFGIARWGLDLTGSSAAFADMASCVKEVVAER